MSRVEKMLWGIIARWQPVPPPALAARIRAILPPMQGIQQARLLLLLEPLAVPVLRQGIIGWGAEFPSWEDVRAALSVVCRCAGP